MRAAVVDRFGVPPVLAERARPVPGPRDALVRVEATGVCRSDWYAWSGHDSTVTPPYVPGHEFVGVIEAVGAEVAGWRPGQRVTAPFVCGCGVCAECLAGRAQVCADQEQPGFTYDGSFAEFVVIRNADLNAVAIPDDIDPHGAALLGCRFATSFRALSDRANVQPGETVAVLGCGGVGLSAVMIATALGARVVAVDVSAGALALAREYGAEGTVDISGLSDADAAVAVRAACDVPVAPSVPVAPAGPVPPAVPVAPQGAGTGADVVVEALGRAATLELGIRSLVSGGRLVQIGLLPTDPVVPMGEIIARELSVFGSHGMAAADYPRLIELVRSGGLRPERLIARRITLDEAPTALADFGAAGPGVTMVVL